MQFLLLSLQTKLRCRSLCVHFFIIWEFAEFWSNCLSLSCFNRGSSSTFFTHNHTHSDPPHAIKFLVLGFLFILGDQSETQQYRHMWKVMSIFIRVILTRDRWHFSTFSGQIARLHFFCRSLNFYCFLLLCGMLLWWLCASFAQSSLHVYSAKER